jgi:uncharacterized cupredoxin-like copper-binding protein
VNLFFIGCRKCNMKRLPLATAAIMAAIALSSCSHAQTVSAGAPSTSTTAPAPTSTTTASSSPSSVSVSEHDFAISVTTSSVPAGNVTLMIANGGPSSHELLAFRTSLADDQLPLGADGRINEDALPKVVDTNTDLAGGTQRVVTATLSPGRYVLVCNLPGHYKLGMHAVLTVT